ncbi:MAG: rhomboid family intramembrane serine protease [Candidatus Eisenbacteria bacterium]|uniref:Rhomboid family intramembrane serine protease n=1 Tax=Eiseniibacteriota bacterium TaxID=2212470 RepID=A0A538TAV6_UNCEI|nr:MAG: rhomboid family intramembrane serine protease [Candidatus Eisenbacteria bacterium]
MRGGSPCRERKRPGTRDVRWDRGGTRPFVIGGSATPAVKALLITNVVVFLFQILSQNLAQVRIERIFGLVPYDVVHHLFLWQLATYMFLHGGFWHGTLVTPNNYTVTIGASGAIYGLLAAYGLLFPDRIILLYFVLPIRAKYLVLILGLITFWSSISATGGGVAHVAHLGGMIFGWLYLRGPRWPRWGNPVGNAYQRWKRKRLRKKFQVYYSKTRGEDEEERR